MKNGSDSYVTCDT